MFKTGSSCLSTSCALATIIIADDRFQVISLNIFSIRIVTAGGTEIYSYSFPDSKFSLLGFELHRDGRKFLIFNIIQAKKNLTYLGLCLWWADADTIKDAYLIVKVWLEYIVHLFSFEDNVYSNMKDC